MIIMMMIIYVLDVYLFGGAALKSKNNPNQSWIIIVINYLKQYIL